MALLKQFDDLVLERSDLKLVHEDFLIVVFQVLHEFTDACFVLKVLALLLEWVALASGLILVIISSGCSLLLNLLG